MGRLRTLSGKQVCAILARYEFLEVRRKGSHIMMKRHGDKHSITVAVPDHRELHPGTLQAIIRQSGVPRHAFES